MGFAQAVLLLHFVFVLAVRQRFKTRAKPSQSSSCRHAVSLVLLSLMKVGQKAGCPWTVTV